MKTEIITSNLLDIVYDTKQLIKDLSTDADFIDMESYTSNILTLIDVLNNTKIIENELKKIENENNENINDY